MSPVGANCTKCGRPKEAKSSGSLTQWIVACNCDTSYSTTGTTGAQPAMCGNCGKRVAAGRSGSFTQWIFRQDICSCAQPHPLSGTGQFGATAATELQQPEIDTFEDEEELAVDGRDFPLDRYKPTAIIGEGVSGRVYLCRDRLLGKRVAVKTLRQLSQTELVSFQREARANSRLDHPGIVRVLDFGVTAQSAPFMVMDYFAGTGLDKIRQARGCLNWQTVFAIMIELCDALAYAHENGIPDRPSRKCLETILAERQARVT